MNRTGYSQRLELRQSQTLVMTPQLQQAIKMLQLSNLELTQFVDAEIQQNPLLERREARLEEAAPKAADLAESPTTPPLPEAIADDFTPEAAEHWQAASGGEGDGSADFGGGACPVARSQWGVRRRRSSGNRTDREPAANIARAFARADRSRSQRSGRSGRSAASSRSARRGGVPAQWARRRRAAPRMRDRPGRSCFRSAPAIRPSRRLRSRPAGMPRPSIARPQPARPGNAGSCSIICRCSLPAISARWFGCAASMRRMWPI